MQRITIATRESRLALWQAEHVRDLLGRTLGFEVRLLGMTTQGDRILDRALSKVGGKGLFVKELEAAMAEGRADLAVHSLKDVPMALPEGFALAAVLGREDARDALVSPRFASLDALPRGACVGTSSLRRVSQLASLRPDLRIEPLRGNLDTRLRKLDEGHYDAIVLAAAGLKRLGLAHRIAATFDEHVMVPAVGQGALALEIRSADAALARGLATLIDRPTWLAVHAERAVSRALEGGCTMPIAAHAHWVQAGGAGGAQSAQVWTGSSGSSAPRLMLRAVLGHAREPSMPVLRAQIDATVADEAQAEALGASVAATLLAMPQAREYIVPAP
jgi:hydroxymethylbilane synthase